MDMMFDTTAYGTYKSHNSPHSDQDGDEEEEEDDTGLCLDQWSFVFQSGTPELMESWSKDPKHL